MQNLGQLLAKIIKPNNYNTVTLLLSFYEHNFPAGKPEKLHKCSAACTIAVLCRDHDEASMISVYHAVHYTTQN